MSDGTRARGGRSVSCWLFAWLAASRASTSWLAGAQLTPEIVVGAGIVGGAVLGWHLRLCHMDAQEAQSRPRVGAL